MLHAANMVEGRASYPSLKGKKVIVTGGGSGIGESIVEAFAAQGARVAFVDIADGPSRALVDRLTPVCEQAPIYAPCDLTDLESLAATFAGFERALGGVDILVNNAANDDRHTCEEVTPAYWDNRINVNLRHQFFAVRAVIPAMQRAGRGAIVNLGSISWHLALPHLVVYQTAKAAIEGMTRALARDLGVHNIRVNTIVPGAVKTPRQDALWHSEGETQRILDSQCLKERVMPSDIAAMALFLASDDARMCTAHSYFVDAGWR